jgi:pilus assembly protein CpaF
MNLFKQNNTEEPIEETEPLDIKKVTFIVQEYIANYGQSIQDMLNRAISGEYQARLDATEYVERLLEEKNIEIIDLSRKEAAKEIFNHLWGLDFLQNDYDDPAVNEIRVNGPGQVYLLKNLETESYPRSFHDNEHIMTIISRMIMHDKGVSLNKSSPTVESMRKDGTRLTATCPPVTENFTFALRKHLDVVLSPEQMIIRGNMSEPVWDILQLLVKGRANLLIAGGVGSGKTTLLRTLFSVTGQNERVCVLESDRELLLSNYFPDRDIVEFEEHPNTGRTLQDLFRTVLRYSPNRIIMGEFRGTGEARSAVEACLRGHDGSMATAHFNSPKEAIEGTARLLLAEGYNVGPEIAAVTVASAYNIVIQMFGDTTRGIIKLDSITDIDVQGANVVFTDLIKWVPYDNDYVKGEWKAAGYVSDRLKGRVGRFGITEDMLGRAGLLPPNKEGRLCCM